jgi:hypothetical protein
MKLVRDYLGFAVWFAGIGYLILWPLTDGANGMPFGGSYVCGTGALSFLCDFDHPLTLPPALHLLGALSTMAVIGQLAFRVLRRLRHPTVAIQDSRLSVLADPRARRSTLQVPRRVKPRNEFGLRRPQS